MHGSYTTVLNNDRTSLEWGRDYREDPAWQGSKQSKGKRGLTADRHTWILIILSHVQVVATSSHPHTSLFLCYRLHCMSVLLSPLHILKRPCLSLHAFALSWSPPTQPLSNKNKNVWNSQGVSWQAIAHSFPVTQPFSAWLLLCGKPYISMYTPSPCIFSW